MDTTAETSADALPGLGRLLDIDELERVTRRDRQFLRREIKDGRLAAYRVGVRVLVSQEAILSWLETHCRYTGPSECRDPRRGRATRTKATK